MKKLPRILLTFSSLLLSTMFLLPLWYIKLEAPQYPEGISMYIRLRTIVGGGEFDIEKINMLNHYIGMKAIDAASIPELRYMPWVVGILMVAGLLVAWKGRFSAFVAWTATFAAVAIAGLLDFYRWGYDYGHNLAPDAIIKIPGMTYQPPLIGTKQLLNFTAHSWPAAGGIAAGLAFALAVVAVVIAARRRHAVRALAAVGVLATACMSSTRPDLAFDGSESCAYCRMSITDPRVGGVVLTDTGKKYTFDSIDCLAGFASANNVAADRIWVADFEHPGSLLPVDDVVFISPPAGVSTGMAGKFVAVARRLETSDGRRWEEVLASQRSDALRK